MPTVVPNPRLTLNQCKVGLGAMYGTQFVVVKRIDQSRSAPLLVEGNKKQFWCKPSSLSLLGHKKKKKA